MKYLIIVLCLLALVGCGDTLKPEEYERAVSLCEANEGLGRLWLDATGDRTVYCNNGAVFYNGN